MNNKDSLKVNLLKINLYIDIKDIIKVRIRVEILSSLSNLRLLNKFRRIRV